MATSPRPPLQAGQNRLVLKPDRGAENFAAPDPGVEIPFCSAPSKSPLEPKGISMGFVSLRGLYIERQATVPECRSDASSRLYGSSPGRV
jgi:hypothetical protein